MEDKWLNEWQKKLDGYEVAPPDGLWDGINKALEERRLSVASSRGTVSYTHLTLPTNSLV